MTQCVVCKSIRFSKRTLGREDLWREYTAWHAKSLVAIEASSSRYKSNYNQTRSANQRLSSSLAILAARSSSALDHCYPSNSHLKTLSRRSRSTTTLNPFAPPPPLLPPHFTSFTRPSWGLETSPQYAPRPPYRSVLWWARRTT